MTREFKPLWAVRVRFTDSGKPWDVFLTALADDPHQAEGHCVRAVFVKHKGAEAVTSHTQQVPPDIIKDAYEKLTGGEDGNDPLTYPYDGHTLTFTVDQLLKCQQLEDYKMSKQEPTKRQAPLNQDQILDELEAFLAGEGVNVEVSEPQQSDSDQAADASEVQFDHAGHSQTYDKTEVFMAQVEPKFEELEAICNEHSIPYQACFEVKSGEDGIMRRHFGNQNSQPVLDTHCGYMIYHLPHGVAHLAMISSQFPFGPRGEASDGANFDKSSIFENDITPKLVAILNTCQLLKVPYQMAFVVARTDEQYDVRTTLIPNPQLPSCEMKAAFALYSAPIHVKYDVVSIYKELNPDEGEEDQAF